MQCVCTRRGEVRPLDGPADACTVCCLAGWVMQVSLQSAPSDGSLAPLPPSLLPDLHQMPIRDESITVLPADVPGSCWLRWHLWHLACYLPPQLVSVPLTVLATAVSMARLQGPVRAPVLSPAARLSLPGGEIKGGPENYCQARCRLPMWLCQCCSVLSCCPLCGSRRQGGCSFQSNTSSGAPRRHLGFPDQCGSPPACRRACSNKL